MENNVDGLLENFYKRKQNCERIDRLIADNNGHLSSLPMNNCYINLVVVKHIDNELDDYPVTTSMSNEHEEFTELRHSFNRPRSSEQINLKQTDDHRYGIDDLFENNTADVGRRIFLLGRAGVGKTTMCKKIVYEYYINRLWNDKFSRIIWLPLRIFKRHLTNDLEHLSLKNLYSDHFCHQIDGAELVEENEKDETKVLYVLDGLDEIQNIVGNTQSPVSILLDHLLSKPFVVVTSRPYTYHDNYGNFDVILETIGFSHENILDYVSVVFSRPTEHQTRKEVIEFIEKSPANISGLVSVPILLDIICCAWTDIRTIKVSTQLTMTRLYSILDIYLWGQYLLRSNQTEAELWRNTVKKKSEVYDLVNKATRCIDVDVLARVAYDMLASNKIEFTTEEAFCDCYLDGSGRIQLKNTNFLYCLNPVDEDTPEMSKSYAFIHLTIQEYLSAVHLVQCFTTNRPKFETAMGHKYNPRYSIVWSFVAGMLADSREEFGDSANDLLLETFFNFLERDPTDEVGIAHQHLIISCLNECSYPSLLNSERECRLIDELLSYIFTQYVAGGKSLFKQQPLPVKLLKKLISQPDDFWEADAKVFKRTVLKEQFLPEEIVYDIINDENSWYRAENLELLKTQKYLGLPAINLISSKIDGYIQRSDTAMVEKYLNILCNKSFLPSSAESLETIKNLINDSAKRKAERKKKVTRVCLNLKEIPLEIIGKLVEKFAKIIRQRNVDDKDWKKAILLEIIKNENCFTAGEMIQLVKQRQCFSEIIDDFLEENLLKQQNPSHFNRLLLVAARRNLGVNLIERLMKIFTNESLQYDTKRFILYVIGNMKTRTLFHRLYQLLIEENLPINLNNQRPKNYLHLKYSADSMQSTPAINFQYLASIIPLMKSEFYEGHEKYRSIMKHKKCRHLTHNQIDLRYFRLLHRDFSIDDIKRGISAKSVRRRADFHNEIAKTLEAANMTDSQIDWINEFEKDGHRFLKTFSSERENLFIGWFLENGNDVRHASHYKDFISAILEEEWEINSTMYYDIIVKYRPLIVLAHQLYNSISAESTTTRTTIQKFEEICERQLLESLIVRALRDSNLTSDLLVGLRSTFCDQIDANRNRFTMNIAKILEFRPLDDLTIGKIIDLTETGDEYAIELTLSLLQKQQINEDYDIEKLKKKLLQNPLDSVMQRTSIAIAKVFEKNKKLLKSVQQCLLPFINHKDINVKLKV